MSFFATNKDRNNEAFGCGTGDGGLLGRRSRSRYGSGCVDGNDRQDVVADSGHERNQEGKEKEGEENNGRSEGVRPDAHEVARSHFLSKPETTEESQMNKLLVALIAGAFASVAAAQTMAPSPTTKEKAKDVQSTTQQAAPSSVDTQKTAAEQAKNVKASKEVPKMTTAEKNKAIKEVNKSMVNPENTSGTAGTAAMQKADVAASKGAPKANTELKTKEGQKALEKELQQKAKGS
ncbi:MAG: hypothetical protein U1F15_14590 [Burkholderiales bacterium]